MRSEGQTDAWILRRGPAGSAESGVLEQVRVDIGPLAEAEVLVEPLYGSWEGNMSHAVLRSPIDICAARDEDFVVIGNAGVVRVLRAGPAVEHLAEGDVCVIDGSVVNDPHGYPEKVLAFDARGTRGVLARRVRMPQQALIPIPPDSTLSLPQWAGMSVRYISAWENWRVAHGCWRVQMPDVDPADMHVWSWGGGVGLAELWLARRAGFNTAMIGSRDARLGWIEADGHRPIDRRRWPDLAYDPQARRDDPERYARFRAAEEAFLTTVAEYTRGCGVDIFVDNIGLPVFRTTLKALARQGVVATSGWKLGMNLEVHRAAECIRRHTHVHTHGSRTCAAWEAVRTAEEVGFRPHVDEDAIVPWSEIPRLATAFTAGQVDSYFPTFQVNPV